MFLTLFFALDASIENLANFFAVKFFPFLTVKLFEKFLDLFKRGEIDKGISYVAVIVGVDGEVEKIKLVFEVSINSAKHLFLSVFVGYVSYHQSFPPFFFDFA